MIAALLIIPQKLFVCFIQNLMFLILVVDLISFCALPSEYIKKFVRKYSSKKKKLFLY